jgi:hypothetical protein
MAKKSVVNVLGCKECAFFSLRGNCIKFGFSSKDINTGSTVHTIDHGIFRLDNIKMCPVKSRRIASLRGDIKPLANIGLIG